LRAILDAAAPPAAEKARLIKSHWDESLAFCRKQFSKERAEELIRYDQSVQVQAQLILKWGLKELISKKGSGYVCYLSCFDDPKIYQSLRVRLTRMI
jgi:hypothetical protein